MSRNSGRIYFKNDATGEKSFRLPPGAVLLPSALQFSDSPPFPQAGGAPSEALAKQQQLLSPSPPLTLDWARKNENSSSGQTNFLR